jgi:hypothetical protein
VCVTLFVYSGYYFIGLIASLWWVLLCWSLREFVVGVTLLVPSQVYRVVLATIAFDMGVDNPDVEPIIHSKGPCCLKQHSEVAEHAEIVDR